MPGFAWYGVDVDIDDRMNAEEGLRATQAKRSRASQIATVSELRDGNSAAEVVSRIRALFTRTDSTRTLLNLNEVIAEVSWLISEEAASGNVTVDTDLEHDLPATWADRVQMQQVIVNLARNGVDAMRFEDSHPKVLSIRSRRDGTNSVLIEIRDRRTTPPPSSA